MLRHQNNDGAHQPAGDSSINNSLVAENMESRPASVANSVAHAEGDNAISSSARAACTTENLTRNDTIDSASDNGPPSLEHLLQALPQELQDMILGFTIITSPSIVRIETERYQPPPLLQINRATRATAAESYYSQTVFACTHEFHNNVEFIRWLRSIPARHRALINRILIPPVLAFPRHAIATTFEHWQIVRLSETQAKLAQMRFIIWYAGLESGMKSLKVILLADCPLKEEHGVIQTGLLSATDIKRKLLALGMPESDSEEEE
ncbi:hypothetical protein CKM354_000509600 [Cercospora kikuchii]|uniref:F-box domain-containing protein n=1 Tax=Cercospora kikuchii TaxID=84275 RepID=A0A9P3CNV0_9PEZI|nr:uncharacterized protein CKM354_000509600 [Cercospora kikuchii]GIZ41803.1 hypothetical protein CKM354_000509600 [Cercospora kikuchii]